MNSTTDNVDGKKGKIIVYVLGIAPELIYSRFPVHPSIMECSSSGLGSRPSGLPVAVGEFELDWKAGTIMKFYGYVVKIDSRLPWRSKELGSVFDDWRGTSPRIPGNVTFDRHICQLGTPFRYF